MIKPWLIALTRFHRAPIFQRIALPVAIAGIYAAAVVLIDKEFFERSVAIRASLHGLLGLVLGMLLVFRTNTAYERWWEGRKLWGQLVNDSRNLTIKVSTCVEAHDAEKQDFARDLIAFAYALKHHLRGGPRPRELAGVKALIADRKHVPLGIAQSIYARIEGWRRADLMGGYELLIIDRHAASLMDISGACERIRRTPLARSYRWFIRQLISIYLFTLPWGLLDDFGWWTVPTMVLVAYFMIGIETIAEDIEEPFGTDADDLRLNDICRAIEASVHEIIACGETTATLSADGEG